MTNNDTNRPMTHAERLARFSQAKEGAPIMPAQVKRLPPRPRRNSVRHRAIR